MFTIAELKAQRDVARAAYKWSMAHYSVIDESSIERHNANCELYNTAQRAYRAAYLGQMTLTELQAAI